MKIVILFILLSCGSIFSALKDDSLQYEYIRGICQKDFSLTDKANKAVYTAAAALAQKGQYIEALDVLMEFYTTTDKPNTSIDSLLADSLTLKSTQSMMDSLENAEIAAISEYDTLMPMDSLMQLLMHETDFADSKSADMLLDPAGGSGAAASELETTAAVDENPVMTTLKTSMIAQKKKKNRDYTIFSNTDGEVYYSRDKEKSSASNFYSNYFRAGMNYLPEQSPIEKVSPFIEVLNSGTQLGSTLVMYFIDKKLRIDGSVQIEHYLSGTLRETSDLFLCDGSASYTHTVANLPLKLILKGRLNTRSYFGTKASYGTNAYYYLYPSVLYESDDLSKSIQLGWNGGYEDFNNVDKTVIETDRIWHEPSLDASAWFRDVNMNVSASLRSDYFPQVAGLVTDKSPLRTSDVITSFLATFTPSAAYNFSFSAYFSRNSEFYARAPYNRDSLLFDSLIEEEVEIFIPDTVTNASISFSSLSIEPGFEARFHPLLGCGLALRYELFRRSIHVPKEFEPYRDDIGKISLWYLDYDAFEPEVKFFYEQKHFTATLSFTTRIQQTVGRAAGSIDSVESSSDWSFSDDCVEYKPSVDLLYLPLSWLSCNVTLEYIFHQSKTPIENSNAYKPDKGFSFSLSLTADF
ncbi:MAG: hypothetical protein JW795_08700 [Chitinivibrionales bacterium]|nr:hypothetical protein [Chitinivibrionales bacterium]